MHIPHHHFFLPTIEILNRHYKGPFAHEGTSDRSESDSNEFK